MAGNKNLNSAAKAKNDEFYTQFDDIQRELKCYLEYDKNTFRDKTILLPCDDPAWSNFTKFFALNFEEYGFKKLISTSYAPNSKKFKFAPMANLFEAVDTESPAYDVTKEDSHGKIYTLDRETIKTKPYPVDAIKLDRYLDGDGDFRSDEVCKLRDEADVIITNPPFSLFREFLAWIMAAKKEFLIIGNINCITYKEVFPLIKDNKIWLGPSIQSGDRKFYVPDEYPLEASTCGIDKYGQRFIRVKGVRWFTNLEHGRRHKPMEFNTMVENLRHCKHKDFTKTAYKKYDNYDAIEVPYTKTIPRDYDGVMGVPITFLDKYCPEQFEILDARDFALNERQKNKNTYLIKDADGAINGKPTYARILIRTRGN